MAARKRTKKLSEYPLPSKYEDRFPDLLITLVVDCGLVNKTQNMPWKRLAVVFGVSEMTLHNWRNPAKPDTYHEDFHKAVKAAQAAVDTNNIKRGLIAMATPHYVYDRTQELRKVGPKPPPKDWYKAGLIDWADKHLDLEIDPAMTKPEVYTAIRLECAEQTEEKMVTVKERRTKVLDVAAAKMVLPNHGPEDERWTDKQEHTMKDSTLTDEDRENVRAILRANQE